MNHKYAAVLMRYPTDGSNNAFRTLTDFVTSKYYRAFLNDSFVVGDGMSENDKMWKYRQYHCGDCCN